MLMTKFREFHAKTQRSFAVASLIWTIFTVAAGVGGLMPEQDFCSEIIEQCDFILGIFKDENEEKRENAIAMFEYQALPQIQKE